MCVRVCETERVWRPCSIDTSFSLLQHVSMASTVLSHPTLIHQTKAFFLKKTPLCNVLVIYTMCHSVTLCQFSPCIIFHMHSFASYLCSPQYNMNIHFCLHFFLSFFLCLSFCLSFFIFLSLTLPPNCFSLYPISIQSSAASPVLP